MSEPAVHKRSFVLFRLGQEHYGLPVSAVGSIIAYEPSTPVPRAPDAVIGVINLRGRVIPVVDLKLRFSGSAFVPGPQSRIVVAEAASGPLGIAVDAASEVTSFSDEDIRPIPEGIVGPETASAFSGMVEREGGLVVLLDLEEALPRREYAAATDVYEQKEEVDDV